MDVRGKEGRGEGLEGTKGGRGSGGRREGRGGGNGAWGAAKCLVFVRWVLLRSCPVLTKTTNTNTTKRSRCLDGHFRFVRVSSNEAMLG